MQAHQENEIFAETNSASKHAVLLSSYGTGAETGKNLGVPGYSHDIVMQLYAPILEKWGRVIPVSRPAENLEAAVVEAQSRGLKPIHLSVIPCHDAYLSPNVPNVLMPAWEFPDIPDHDFGLNPQNDWRKVANICDALIVSGPFTANAFRKSGVKVPIHFVQVPTAAPYFQLGVWQANQSNSVQCSGYSFVGSDDESEKTSLPIDVPTRKVPRGLKKVGRKFEKSVRRRIKSIVNEKTYRKVSNGLQRRKRRNALPQNFDFNDLDLSGVVYTSIFNPNDGRKNWQDLLTSFLVALADKADATLVIKLVTKDPVAIAKFIRFYRGRAIKHKCRLVVTAAYLSDQQLIDLTEASTYYIQTTKAEGNCLPLMNFLAAGRPGVSPSHSAISDYFDDEVGFVAESHPEPAAWPHDPRLRTRSTWARLVWTSMVEQIQGSYRVATEDRARYEQLSRLARERMNNWASSQKVEERLLGALQAVHNQTAATPRTTCSQSRRAA